MNSHRHSRWINLDLVLTCRISGRVEPRARVLWGHLRECVHDGLFETLLGSCFSVAQVFFDFAPHARDGIEVG